MEQTTVNTITKFHNENFQKDRIQQKTELTKKSTEEIKQKILSLNPGESLVYMTQDVSWSNMVSISGFIKFFDSIRDNGDYVFTQRLAYRCSNDMGVYDYIVKRIS